MFDATGVSDDQQVFRAYARKNHCDSSAKPTFKLFLRREAPGDEHGLSVGSSPDAATRHLAYYFGCCCLIAGGIRSIEGLEVVPDDTEHGNITGAPRRSEDEQRAIQVASDLYRIAGATDFPARP